MKNYATVLVTGGAGFVGRHVVKSLISALHFPVVLDNAIPSYALEMPGCIQVDGSIEDKKLLSSLFTQFDFDAVIHLAACSEVQGAAISPVKFHQNNFSATMALLESMLNFGIQRMIFSSSAAVYGEPQYTPMNEKHPCHPNTRHGLSKYFIERVLHDCNLTCGLRCIILRHYSVTGYNIPCTENTRQGNITDVISSAFDAAIGDTPVFSIYGADFGTPDGTCVRDYVHVEDVAEAYVAAVDSLMNGGRSAVYNIGSGSGYSVRELLDLVRKVTQRTISEMVLSRRPGDAAALIADSGKIRAELGWRPRFTDMEGIVRAAWNCLLEKSLLN